MIFDSRKPEAVFGSSLVMDFDGFTYHYRRKREYPLRRKVWH